MKTAPARISFVLAFASGAAALAHETLWTRRLVDVLGASAETFSKVVGAFFLGLALGAWLASNKKTSPRAGWLGVAFAEAAVGLLAVPVLFSPQWSEALFANAALVPLVKLFLPILLVVPPAMAMGQGLLPLLLRGDPKSAATLGVATGSTAAGVALNPDVERIDAIELSPLVLRYAEEFFAPYNRDVFRDPRAHFIHEDARWVMARERETYDVIVGDLFLPWHTGEGRLFTREHFQNVRHALKPGGLYCQWLPLFQLTHPQFEAIARTFRQVFPDAFLMRGDFYCELPIIGLVGGCDFAKIDWQAVAEGCAKLRRADMTKDPLVRHVEGVAMLMLGPLPDPGIGPVNTLANAWLEWDAARNILGMRSPWFIGTPGTEYVRSIQHGSQTLLPQALRDAQEAGEFFLKLEVAAKMNLPEKTELEAQIPQRLPPALRDDAAAEWQQWPSRVKPSVSDFQTSLKP